MALARLEGKARLTPLVSVCITTYNRRDLLPVALTSVSVQTYSHIEILIVDDCSSDGTDELVRSHLSRQESRIRYFRHEQNRGLACARNTGITHAKGKYFTFCDDDDEWCSNFVEEFVKISKDFDERWCFCCGTRNQNPLGGVTSCIPDHFKGSLRDYVKQGYTPPVGAQFYHLDTLKRVGGYNELVRSGVDHDLWIRLARDGVNISTLPLALSWPNTNQGMERMTRNHEMRLARIQEALRIWRNDLVGMYGEEFWEEFYRAYLQRETEKFVVDYIASFQFGRALSMLGGLPSRRLVRAGIKSSIKRGLSYLPFLRVFGRDRAVLSGPALRLALCDNANYPTGISKND
jgi:glycosyltransferase involved in cell wall biosynthesis